MVSLYVSSYPKSLLFLPPCGSFCFTSVLKLCSVCLFVLSERKREGPSFVYATVCVYKLLAREIEGTTVNVRQWWWWCHLIVSSVSRTTTMMSNYSTLPRLRRRLNTDPPVPNREPQQLVTQESSAAISSLRRLAYSTSMKLRRTASTSSDVVAVNSLRQRLKQRRKSSYQLPVSIVLSDDKHQHWLTNQDEDEYFDSDFVSLIC